MISSVGSGFVFFYLAFAFGFMSFNPKKWEGGATWVCLFGAVLLGLVTAMCRYTPSTVTWL